MLRLCPASTQQVQVQPVINTPSSPSPSPPVAPVVPPVIPPVAPTTTPGTQPIAVLPGGWSVVSRPATPAAPKVQAQAGPAQGVTVPPLTAGQAGFPGLSWLNAPAGGVQPASALASLDAFLQARFGAQCADPQCSNIKAKFWAATAALVYAKAEHSGKFQPGDLLDKLAGFLPGVSAAPATAPRRAPPRRCLPALQQLTPPLRPPPPLQSNPLLSKLADGVRTVDSKEDALSSALRSHIAGAPAGLADKLASWKAQRASWEDKKTSLLAGASLWYDKLQQHMAGDMGGLGALFSGAMAGGEGLRALGIDPAAAMSAIGPLLGLNNPDDAKALMEGLQQSGFEELLAEFVTPFQR
jgi:hypothetical protein